MANLLDAICERYLKSGDFNGLPVLSLAHHQTEIVRLIESGAADLVRGDAHPNPHIKALPPDSIETQIEKIQNHGLGHGCLYPTPSALQSVVRACEYADKPYSLELALGSHCLAHRAFDVRTLEFYVNDPRFKYVVSDSHGSIYLNSTEEAETSADNVYLDRFGFCFSSDRKRAIAAFLWDLFRLEADQQVYWKQRQLEGTYHLHPAFYRSSILGDWPEGCSIFQAVCKEIEMINDVCGLIGFPKFFKSVFSHEDQPKRFHFLIRPTQGELNEFIHLLDKMLSENINRKFFEGMQTEKVSFTEDGEKIVTSKGTLALFSEWLERNIRFQEEGTVEMLLAPLKKVRKLRQKPAHIIVPDQFDPKFFDEQSSILQEVWSTLYGFRLLLSRHPSAKAYKAPSWYDTEKIWLP